jgi:hypothetical protein
MVWLSMTGQISNEFLTTYSFPRKLDDPLNNEASLGSEMSC